jgi:predicted transcriptional regulator of viral defense system
MLGYMEGRVRETGAGFPKLTPDPLDVRLARTADAQHGVVSLTQLRALGLSDSAARKRAAAGRLHRVHRGVYAVGRARLDSRGRRMAAVLTCGPGAMLSTRTAADATGFLRSASARIEVTVPGHGTMRRPGIVIHRSARLRPKDFTKVDGIPCTTVARTLLDLAAVVSPSELARAIEGAERLRLLDVRVIDEALRRAPTRAAARLRTALAKYAGAPPPPTRKELERRAFQLFAEAGLPRPDVNVLVHTREGPFEVDFCWPDRRLIVEADSFEFHRTRKAFENDRRRDQLLVESGWTPVRITWRQVDENPDQVKRCVQTAAW